MRPTFAPRRSWSITSSSSLLNRLTVLSAHLNSSRLCKGTTSSTISQGTITLLSRRYGSRGHAVLASGLPGGENCASALPIAISLSQLTLAGVSPSAAQPVLRKLAPARRSYECQGRRSHGDDRRLPAISRQ